MNKERNTDPTRPNKAKGQAANKPETLTVSQSFLSQGETLTPEQKAYIAEIESQHPEWKPIQ